MTITSETNDFNIVRDVMKKTPLLSLKLKWDWKEFEWLYVFEFNGRWMYQAAYDPYILDEIGLIAQDHRPRDWSGMRNLSFDERNANQMRDTRLTKSYSALSGKKRV